MKPDIEEMARKLTKELSDQGKIIEGGWVGFRMVAMHKDAPPLQVEEMRNAFFAGAQNLFASIMVMLDPVTEPTDQDLNRMTLIHEELDNFIANFKEKNFSYGQKGTA